MNDLEFFLDVAKACAKQSSCLRRHYGAVIVDKNRQIISTGYNSVPSGMLHCDQRNSCMRDKLGIEQYADYSLCYSIHSEQNALIQAGRLSRGCILYLYGWDVKKMIEITPKPCFLCTKMIINAGIDRVITRGTIHDPIDLYNEYVSRIDP